MRSRQKFTVHLAEYGFTLMEMVVAVFVISVMMAVLMPHLLGASTRAQTTACELDQRTIRAALSEYYMIHHAYPTGDTATQLAQLQSNQLIDAVPKEPAGGNFIVDDTDPNNVVVSCSVHGTLGGSQ